MRSFIVLALLIAAVAVVQGAVDIEKAIKLLNKCKKETGATENVEDMIKTKTIPTTPEGKCMILCAAREKGFVKDDRINTKAISDFVEAKYADEPEKLEKAAETLAKCSTIDTSGLEKCDKAVAYVKCAKDNNFEI